MSQVYRVGRDRGNDIVLDDATVSRAHAELRLEGNGDVLLVDLDSTNGTCVRDGNKWIEIDRATVDADERILIGDVVTTVDALLARRDAMLTAYDGRLAEEKAAVPAPANDSGRVADRDEPPLLHAVGAVRGASQRLASDFARLVFRPGRSVSGAAMAPVAARSEASGPARAPSFRTDDLDSRAESPSLIARRIGERIGQRERLPSIQVEPNPARRVEMSQTKRRHWLKPAVLATAASMFLVAAVAALAIHGASNGPDGGARQADGKQPDASATPKGGPTRVADRPNGTGLPAGMFAFGGARIDSFRAVATMTDGGYLAVGSTESGGAGGFDMWLVRVDPAGNALWEKRFGGTGDDYGLAVAATADGGALVGGAADGRRYIWLLKIDAKGDVRWNRRIDAGYRGHVTAIATTRDGYIVTAIAEPKKDAPANGLLLRLDADGGSVWERRFGPAYTWISSVRAAAGAFVVAGVTKEAAQGPNVLWVAKVGADGKTIWEKKLARDGGRDAEAFARMAVRDDVIVATTHQTTAPGGLWPTRHARIVRLDKDGNVIWRYMHKGDGYERVGGMVLVRGGILLAGTTAAPAVAGGTKTDKSDLWLARIGTDKKVVWERRYGGAGADGASGFDQVGRNGFVVVGTTDAGPGRERDGLLVAVDRDGRIVRRPLAKKE